MDRLVIERSVIETKSYSGLSLKGLVGNKGVGLLDLPESWTPPFVMISTLAHARWRQDSGSLLSELDSDPTLGKFLDARGDGPSSAIVRSSAVDETLDDRGLYESLRCEFTRHSILRTAGEIWDKIERSSDISKGGHPLQMALVIQVLIEPRLFGHLSNERRVSSRNTLWACEIESSTVGGAQTHRFGITKTTNAIDPLPRCHNEEELEFNLKIIAACSSSGQRIHFEWVWDGARLWVVQKDAEQDYIGPAPCSAWIRPSSNNEYEAKALVEESRAEGAWRKINCVRTFRACGIPTANLFVLEQQEILHALAEGEATSQLRDDLDWLCDSPIVIRIDVSEDSGLIPEMQPRTDCVAQVDKAIEFLTSNATRFRQQGVGTDQFCFIFHRFIPAKACAYSYSRPGFSRVRIDSTWGFPDSLFYYPHDSFEVDLDRHGKVKRKIRGKYEFLDLTAEGDWCPRRTGRPFDWKPSLNDSFLLDIARSSHKISKHLDSPVEMMFFVDIPPGLGHPTCLPWFYNTNIAPRVDHSQSIRSKEATSFILSSAADLDSLGRLLDGGDFDDARGPRALLVKLKPRGEFVRSQGFLQRSIDLLKGKSCIVELEGSMLTHSYYLLARSKIPVKSVDPFEPKPRVRRFGKLVRDLIPVRIQSHGEAAQIIRASPEELVDLLKAKAVEEAFELFWETHPDRMHEELADLLEVIKSICEVTGMGFSELVSLAERKRSERGGFNNGVILIETREVPLINRIASEADESNSESSLFADTAHSTNADNDAATQKASNPRGIGYQLKAGIREFSLPLVPPSISSLNRINRIAIPGGKWSIEVTYQEKNVVLSLRRKAEEGVDSEQPLLF